jgi:phosphohistidine phosphatase
MNLYLLRHAHALEIGEQGVQTDEERPLSEEGIKRMAVVAEAVKRLGLKFDQVVTSPLRRSVQTAEELVRQLDAPQPALATCERLSPGWSSKKLAKYLLGVEGQEVLLVGHEPDLSKHAAWLIGDKEARLEFAKGALACIRLDGLPQKGGGTLMWLITPKLMAAGG